MRRWAIALPSATPDFLSRLEALANFMRLSLLKAAHAGVAECSVAGNPGTLRSGWQSQSGGRWPTSAWMKVDGQFLAPATIAVVSHSSQNRAWMGHPTFVVGEASWSLLSQLAPQVGGCATP